MSQTEETHQAIHLRNQVVELTCEIQNFIVREYPGGMFGHLLDDIRLLESELSCLRRDLDTNGEDL